ncbi:MAG: lysophospholipid acyltransferase family protein [Chitinophagaceae bacterium]|nr:lysophospholipid acyltransferase family protein [Chitinophagaceae bacterium]
MYYIVLGLLYLFSFLPLWVIYRISDFFYFILCYVLGYRRKVLIKNLSIAFPEKTEAEKKKIIKKFYRNFTDTFLEAIKLLSMSEKSLQKRISFDPSIYNELYNTGKSCQVHLGHNFNWEWVNVRVTKQLAYPFLVVYMPIGNKLIDRLFMHFREKTGSIMLPATDMRNAMLPFRNTQYLLALVADQNPGQPEKSYWIQFFDRWTPFVKGPEKNARFNNIPVVFTRFSKPKRGYYVIESKLATINPSEMKEGELTLAYVRYLEEVIRKQPEIYLWSHNRWKFEYKEEYRNNKIEDQQTVSSLREK